MTGTTNNNSDIDGALATKSIPVGADNLIILDSAANNNLKQTPVSAVASPGAGFFNSVGAITNNSYYGTIPFGYPLAMSSNSTALTNTIYYVPFQVNITSTFKSINIYCSATTGGGNINLGIYNSNTKNSAPTGNPITGSTSGSIAVTVAAKTFAFITPITLSPGIYWLALFCEKSSNVFDGTSNTGAAYYVVMGLGYTAPVQTGAYTAGYSTMYSQTATYSTTLPTVGTLALEPASRNPYALYLIGN